MWAEFKAGIKDGFWEERFVIRGGLGIWDWFGVDGLDGIGLEKVKGWLMVYCKGIWKLNRLGCLLVGYFNDSFIYKQTFLLVLLHI